MMAEAAVAAEEEAWQAAEALLNGWRGGGTGGARHKPGRWRSQMVMEGSIRGVCLDGEGMCAFSGVVVNCPLFLPASL